MAQEWQTVANLAGVDFTGLTPAKKTVALKALRTQECYLWVRHEGGGVPREGPELFLQPRTCIGDRRRHQSRQNRNCRNRGIQGFQIRIAGPTHKLLDDPVPIPTLGSPVMGPANAPITLVEFSDFQCPYCSKAVAQINATLKAYPNDVRLIFKQYPLETHPAASISAAASLAAHQQGKFWPMHDVMFANRPKLSRQSILAWAKDIGLDMKRFTADLDSDAIKKAVLRDQADGDKAGVEGTPTVFLNGQKYNGDLAPEAIKTVIDGELKRLAALKK